MWRQLCHFSHMLRPNKPCLFRHSAKSLATELVDCSSEPWWSCIHTSATFCLECESFSSLCPTVSSCVALVLSGAPWVALCRLLLLGCGCLGFAFEGLGRIQFVEIGISCRVSWAGLAAERQWLVQGCPLLQREQEIEIVMLFMAMGT